MPITDQERAEFDKLVHSNKVVLFMKGNRNFPQCGFSATVVGILNQLTSGYKTVNIFEDPSVREGMKEYSSWPTFPQLYVNGEFVGGCDIVKAMHATGELKSLLGGEGGGAAEVADAPVKPPAVTISPAAAKAFKDAAADAGGDVLRLEIDPQFNGDLHFGPKAPGDLEVQSNGVTLHVARGSAARAEGITIDFVEGPRGAGFKIENPNEPPRVKPLTPTALKAMLDTGNVELFDVRPDAERALASIPQAKKLDAAGQKYVASLSKNVPIALHCHHGTRSRNAAEQLLNAGHTHVYNLEGGIAAWSRDVDPSIPQY